ncbi:hypothetical protein CsatA_004141 [Cannabis sativa]
MMSSNFSCWDFYSSIKVEGRILLLWRKNFVNVEVIEHSMQHVHCHIKMIGQRKDYFATFIYGANNVEGRGNDITNSELVDSNNWIAQSCVGPMKRRGSTFTCNNKQDNRIFSCINHVSHNEEWVDDFLNTSAHFSWETCCDHCLCVVHSLSTESIGSKPFRFYNFWIDHQNYKKIGIYLKTMRLKHKLKAFNRHLIGNIGNAYEKAKESYKEAQFQCQANLNNNHFLELERATANHFHIQEKMYLNFLHQRSKVIWIQKGDSNTTYFHAMLKKRNEENKIVSFITEQGNLNDHFPNVMQHFLGHFKAIMGKAKPTSMEIHSDCIAMGPKLNLDQQSVWPEVGKDIHIAITHCFDTNEFPEELQSTTLSLIPKIDGPSKAIDYRPIACCTTLCKCVSKYICSRLANALPSLVSQKQGAFVKGRSIAYNILILYDVMLDEFSRTSGLSINFAKSEVYFGGIAQQIPLAQKINLSIGEFPLKYLGIPLKPTKWRLDDCGPILKKIKLKLHSWANKHLSYAGRVQLIQSTLIGLRNYWMRVFLLPQSVIKEIEKLYQAFLWGLKDNRTRAHLISWERVCLTKAYGGLGFKDGTK